MNSKIVSALAGGDWKLHESVRNSNYRDVIHRFYELITKKQ